MTANRPPAHLLQAQAGWLAPARARLLRRVAIARRTRLLDLGAGSGPVTGELVRRSGGVVVALDQSGAALRRNPACLATARPVGGDARKLPFRAGSFDLVFCQLVLMWVSPAQTIQEIWRVLQPGGVVVALEPDYGGLIEHPPQIATGDLWRAALQRAGADPLIGRKLPGLLAAQGFEVRVDLLAELAPPSPLRFELLRGLPLTPAEQQRLRAIEAEEATKETGPWAQVVHLPFILATGTR